MVYEMSILFVIAEHMHNNQQVPPHQPHYYSGIINEESQKVGYPLLSIRL